MRRRLLALCTLAALVACRAPRTQLPPTPSADTPEACVALIEHAEDPASTQAQRAGKGFAACAALIGNAHYTKGVPALVTMVDQTDRFDSDAFDAVFVALAQMPDESEPLLIHELEDHLEDPFRSAWTVQILTNISRPAGHAAMARLMKQAETLERKEFFLEKLTRYPRSESHVKAFLALYAEEPADPPWHRTSLINMAPELFDPKLVPWLLDIAREPTADDERRRNAFRAATLLMTSAYVGRVESALEKGHAAKEEKAFFLSSRLVIAECEWDAACYVNLLRVRHQGQHKAVWMAAMLGGISTRRLIVTSLPTMVDPRAKLEVLKALVFLAPEGDPAAAFELDALVEEERRHPAVLSFGSSYRNTALTLRSRATAP